MMQWMHTQAGFGLQLQDICFDNVTFFMTLEDSGELPLAFGEPEYREETLYLPLIHEERQVTGYLALKEEPGFVWMEFAIQSFGGTFSPGGMLAGRKSFGLRFGSIQGLQKILAEYLTKPWWTQPAFPETLAQVPELTQLLLCRTDTSSLFVLPLVGEHFKTELVGTDRGLELAAHTYDCGLLGMQGQLAAFSLQQNPYAAVEKGYAMAVHHGLIRTPLKATKVYPEMMEYIGWCSWNAFYQKVDAKGLTAKLEELREKKAPIRWILIDDGWSCTQDGMLTDFQADPVKFPQGLKGFADIAKEAFGMAHIGVWHAFDGYWEGILPGSPVAQRMACDLSTTKTGKLLPGFAFRQSFDFYNTWHQYLHQQGISFVKVDNQSSILHLLRNSAPMSVVAETHRALETSVAINFPDPLINCMGMANEDAFARDGSAVSRSSDDFFPDIDGSFVTHIMQNAYNSVFFDQLFVCDYDMWWTQHPSAQVSSVLRAISGGPVYISDKVGETDVAMLWPLVETDGRLIRCDHAAKPAPSCLFEDVPHASGVLKLTNICGKNPVTALFNLTDEERQVTLFRTDTECLPGTTYLAYLHFAKKYILFDEPLAISVAAGASEIVNFYPVEQGCAMVGDEAKFISAGSRERRLYTL